MNKFIHLMAVHEGMRVLDMGGQPEIWDSVACKLKITILNLPGIAQFAHHSHHDIDYVEGDACHMPQYKSGDFDLIFSNSVIEHVGGVEKRKEFANEIKRLNAAFWVQTPYKYYPIEAHCGMPFWWLYPESLRQHFIRKWEKKLPAWSKMVKTTDIVSAKEMQSLFPTACLIKEWIVFPKSMIAYSRKN